MIRRCAQIIGIFAALSSVCFAADFDAAGAINQTGLDIYRDLASGRPDANLVVSPYSIERALVLAYAGASGATREELAAALHLPVDEKVVRPAFATLHAALAKVAANSARLADRRARDRSATAGIVNGQSGEPPANAPGRIVWREASRLFVQDDYGLRGPFVRLMRNDYAAPLGELDFRRKTEPARLSINRWVAAQTAEKIAELIPPGGVSNATRLVLVNAVHLNAPWEKPFRVGLTKLAPFRLPTGSRIEVPTMLRGGPLGYERKEGLTIVAVDYLGGELQCLLMLPDEGIAVDDAINKVTPANFARWAQLRRNAATPVDLYLPRFKIKGATAPLGKTLRQLGVRRAFDEPPGSADFDAMAPRRANDYLKFSEVFHQAFIALDEKGTEAAAATAVVMMVTGAADPTKPVEVHFDRPFLFAIQHAPSGACLFLGRVTDPR